MILDFLACLLCWKSCGGCRDRAELWFWNWRDYFGNHVFLLGNYILSFGGSDSSTNLVIIVINIPGWFCFIVYWVASHFPISFLSCFSRSSWLTVNPASFCQLTFSEDSPSVCSLTFKGPVLVREVDTDQMLETCEKCSDGEMNRVSLKPWRGTVCCGSPEPLSFSDSQNSEMLLNSQSQFITMNGYSSELSEIEKGQAPASRCLSYGVIWTGLDT